MHKTCEECQETVEARLAGLEEMKEDEYSIPPSIGSGALVGMGYLVFAVLARPEDIQPSIFSCVVIILVSMLVLNYAPIM